MELLDTDSAAARLRAIVPKEALEPVTVIPQAEPMRFYRPLSSAVDEFITEAQDQKRIYLGVDAFDTEMRGVGGGHTCVIVGYSHSGKTQFFVHVLRSNRDKKIVLFTEDEPATLVLAKLASVQSGVNARQLEELVAQNDTQTIALLRAIADEDFPNLIVFDQHLDARTYGYAWEEAQQVWGCPGDMMAWDYLELINSGGETVQQKFDWVKAFGKSRNIPNFVLHQTSRTAGAEGRQMTISSGAYGGEQHATFMIGVWRQKAAIAAELKEQNEKYVRTQKEETLIKIKELEHDYAVADFTLSTNLVKNKRPGGTTFDEPHNFEIIHGTGALVELGENETPRQYLAAAHAAEAHRKANTHRQNATAQWQEEEMF